MIIGVGDRTGIVDEDGKTERSDSLDKYEETGRKSVYS